MLKGRLASLTTAALTLAVLAVPAVATAKVEVGVSDQLPQTFADPFFKGAKLTIARYIVPYDVVSDAGQTAKLEAWLTAAKADNEKILISFEHSRKSKAAGGKVPSVSTYTKDVTAFNKKYGKLIKDVSPWNEVNRQYQPARGEGQPTYNKVKQVAQYYGVALKVFKGKNIVALDVLDQPNVKDTLKYIAKFKSEVKKQKLKPVKIWGLHPYSDINRFSQSRTKAMLKATAKGDVWLTEASGIVEFGRSFPHDVNRAAAADKCMFTITKMDKRIKRLYRFGWLAGGGFDAGVINEDGTPRPAYAVVKHRTAAKCKKPSGSAGPKTSGTARAAVGF